MPLTGGVFSPCPWRGLHRQIHGTYPLANRTRIDFLMNFLFLGMVPRRTLTRLLYRSPIPDSGTTKEVAAGSFQVRQRQT